MVGSPTDCKRSVCFGNPGLTTAFGGGIVRNILLGIPLTSFWEQGTLFTIALTAMMVVEEIYAVWAMLAGFIIWMKLAQGIFQLYLLFGVIILFRMLSVFYGWKLPRRSLKSTSNS